MKTNEDIFTVIKILTKSIVDNDGLVFKNENQLIKFNNAKYILNQLLRQFALPVDNIYVSQKAYELWNKITSKSIIDYVYKENVICENEEPIKVEMFRGNEKQPYKTLDLIKGSVFTYNDVFHEDHIIPVAKIIEELCDLEKFHQLTNENIISVLNKIKVCKMLKREDRNIHQRSKRPLDVDKIINTIYKPNGVYVERLADILNK